MKLKMRRGFVVVEAVKGEEKTAAGIIVEKTVMSGRENYAIVTDIHPATAAENQIHTGDEVLINPFAVHDIYVGASERMIIKPSDIIAIVERESTDESKD